MHTLFICRLFPFFFLTLLSQTPLEKYLDSLSPAPILINITKISDLDLKHLLANFTLQESDLSQNQTAKGMSESGGSQGLSKTAIIGLAVGGVAAVVLSVAVGSLVYRNMRQKDETDEQVSNKKNIRFSWRK